MLPSLLGLSTGAVLPSGTVVSIQMVHKQPCGQGAPRKISFTWTLATGMQPSQGEQGEPNESRDGSLTRLLYRLVAEEQKAVPYSLSVQWLCHLGLYKCLYDVHSTK